MAIFSAGCIDLTSNRKKIRKEVYTIAKNDLDSPAMKISIRKSPTCINYIAFLPKEKIYQENILKAVEQSDERRVIIFELDYKHVGVVCEYKRIVDYILDKPVEFAKERGYRTQFVDDIDGSKLVLFNLDKVKMETRLNYMIFFLSSVLSLVVLYGGYDYMKSLAVNKKNKQSLEKQYKKIVQKEFGRSKKIAKKIDTVSLLEDIEGLTQSTDSFLEKVTYEKNNFCVKVNTPSPNKFIHLLPKNTVVKTKDVDNKFVFYCYKEI